MDHGPPRLRMFAGPNGSGKSTIKALLRPELLGVYLNSDEIQQSLSSTEGYSLTSLRSVPSEAEIRDFLRQATVLNEKGFVDQAQYIQVIDRRLRATEPEDNAYVASAISDFLRQALIKQKISFSFETVMSHQSKVDLLCNAQNIGYRTYLYYVATEDPEINISRVQNRVRDGGHDVPEDKIRSRYFRSLDLLLSAIRCSNRAYIFDNSTDKAETLLIAECEDGAITLKQDSVPSWFASSVLDKAK